MFVLVAVTAGDELAPPQKSLVAASNSFTKLETLKQRRAVERAEFTQTYGSLVEMLGGDAIAEDVIEELSLI